jgi:hypothetical protein
LAQSPTQAAEAIKIVDEGMFLMLMTSQVFH